MPEGEGCSPFQKGRLMATFGPSQFFVPKWGCIERPVQYARLRAPNRSVQNHEHDVRFLREAVWRNDRLNSFIAHAAKAIATGRVSHLPLQPDSPDLGTVPSVILAVDNVEHAAELARRLQDWSVDCGADPHTEGLSPRGLRVLRQALQSAPRPASRMRIMTADALRTHGVGDAGVLVWCGTSGGLPPIPRSSLLAESGTRLVTQPLLTLQHGKHSVLNTLKSVSTAMLTRSLVGNFLKRLRLRTWHSKLNLPSIPSLAQAQ